MMAKHTLYEVRNGAWYENVFESGQMFSDLDEDSRPLEQMRRDILTERVSRAIARAEQLRSDATAAPSQTEYHELYSQMIAANAEASAILATIETLQGEDEREIVETTANALWHQLSELQREVRS